MKVILTDLVCNSCKSLMNIWSSNGEFIFCENEKCSEYNIKYKFPTMELEKYET